MQFSHFIALAFATVSMAMPISDATILEASVLTQSNQLLTLSSACSVLTSIR